MLQFFNPRTSTISVSVSVSRRTVQISLAKALDPNFKGRPAKGQKMYDHDNSLFFSLTPEESAVMFRAFDPLMKGTYVNSEEKNEKYKNVLTLTHFREDQPYRLIVSGSKDAKGNLTGSIVLTIIPPQGQGNYVSYVFRSDELDCFRSFIFHGFNSLPFLCAFRDGIAKAEKQKSYDEGNSPKTNSPKQTNGAAGDSGPETTFEFSGGEPAKDPNEIDFKW
jgi:hypothetical protein